MDRFGDVEIRSWTLAMCRRRCWWRCAGARACADFRSAVPGLAARAGQAQPAPLPGGTREWSGEAGASGHPLMTVDAIRAAAADFPNCIARMWPDAARAASAQQNFAAFTRDLTPDLRIMDLLDAQPEFTKAFWDYLDTLVSDARIARGNEMLAQYRTTFDAVEKAYGVDRYTITAIWGVEIELRHDRRRPAGAALDRDARLRRAAAAYFKEEFLSTLEILNRGDVQPDRLKGSWAGAFGPTQFMPTSFKRFAVDFDGDGRRDVVDSVPDIIASTANNLKLAGWVPGQTWGYEVVAAAGLRLSARRPRQAR